MCCYSCLAGKNFRNRLLPTVSRTTLTTSLANKAPISDPDYRESLVPGQRLFLERVSNNAKSQSSLIGPTPSTVRANV